MLINNILTTLLQILEAHRKSNCTRQDLSEEWGMLKKSREDYPGSFELKASFG